ncbi:hypothetical protein GINT2_000370 [Glugoides intestinalis]
MEEAVFDLVVEGTTLKDLFLHNCSQSVVVIEKAANYGTTYHTLAELSESVYISEFKIHKNKYSNNNYRMAIEAFPFLLVKDDPLISKFSKKVFGNELEYVDIKKIYYLEDSLFILPISKTDIFDLNITKEDKFNFYRAIKEKSLDVLKNNFSEKTHAIYKMLVENSVFTEIEFKSYCENFGDASLLYPIYGISEISETACMSNSFNNVTYVLNKNLEEFTSHDIEYQHCFKCDLGIIKGKHIIRSALKRKDWNIRVIIIKEIPFPGNFIMFIKVPLIKTGFKSDSEVIKVISVDSSAEVCENGYQIIYFVSDRSPIPDSTLKMLNINKNNVYLDLCFKTIYDIDQFKSK